MGKFWVHGPGDSETATARIIKMLTDLISEEDLILLLGKALLQGDFDDSFEEDSERGQSEDVVPRPTVT